MDPTNLRVLMMLHRINDPDVVDSDATVEMIGALVKVILAANPEAARGAWIAWLQSRGTRRDQRSLEAQWNSLGYDYTEMSQDLAFQLLQMQASLLHREAMPNTVS